MARKKKKQGQSKAVYVPETSLPQNILPMGESVLENKNIYISQKVYKQIHRFAKKETVTESGGILIGSIVEETETIDNVEKVKRTNIIINGFIEAKHTEATPTTLTFTSETWDYVNELREKKFPKGKVVGWIHTHPSYGIKLSDYDKFIQGNFFSNDYEVAYVIDQLDGVEGFYFWINGELQHCKGFYIYDKIGEEIKIDVDKDLEDGESGESKKASLFQTVVMWILTIAVLVLAISNYSLNTKLNTLQEQQTNLMNSANQSLIYMQQQISSLKAEIDALTAEPENEASSEETEQTDGNQENKEENTEENTEGEKTNE